eukprot:Hpha_TRINITY_DN11478_c0_g1::TRINITY_DN11478_c0_g1_i1::g.137577::m.137577
MTSTDWKQALGGQHWMYEQLHELTRPGWIAPIELGVAHGGRQHHPSYMRPEKVLGRDTTSLWSFFQIRHGDFFAGTNWPYCKGFARLSGMTAYMPDNKASFKVKSAMECCELCAKASLSTKGQTCTTFTWDSTRQHCSYHMVMGDGVLRPDRNFKLDPLYILQRRPETVLTHDSGVLVESCPKCSEGLGGIPFRSTSVIADELMDHEVLKRWKSKSLEFKSRWDSENTRDRW